MKLAFDSPDRYGKGLDWTGYTVHDAANILRRYFNQLPEPIIPLEFYERFREPLRNHQAQAVGHMDLQAPTAGPFDPDQAIRAYQALITELPPLNRQLLLYILDLLAVFASKSDLNKMTTANLAAIFQPGLLSHPQHDMAPAEYRLSQDVLIFLIENQDHFLIGMHGTAADEKTVRDVQSAGQSSRGPNAPVTPVRSKTIVGRSSSNASAGADSVRRFGNLRRNMSVSSKTSKRSAGPQAPSTPTTISSKSSGVYRSNTVPSKRSGASPRFPREKSSDPPTPSPGLPTPLDTTMQEVTKDTEEESTPVATAPPVTFDALATPASPEIVSASSSEATTPHAAPSSEASSAILTLEEQQTPENVAKASLVAPLDTLARDRSAERVGLVHATPSRVFLDFLKPSPTSSDEGKREGRRPNKLQKKRIPGSALSSAQSSAHSLQHGPDGTEEQRLISPITPTFDSQALDYTGDHSADRSVFATAPTSPRHATPQRTHTDSTLRPAVSPSRSFHSQTSHENMDASDADYATDATHGSTSGEPTRSPRRHRWRLSQSAIRSRDRDAVPTESPSYVAHHDIGTLAGAGHSKSTIGSGGAGSRQPRRSSQELSGSVHNITEPEGMLSDSEERRKGPVSWIKGKLAERKERQERARSPTKLQHDVNFSRHSLALASPERRGNNSADIPRQHSQGSTTAPDTEKVGNLPASDEQMAT